MNEDRPSSAADERPQRSWLERLGQLLSSEPRDRDDLIHILRDAQDRAVIDYDAVRMIEGVLSVSQMQARDIMIPRSQMTVVEWDNSLDDFLPVIIDSAHSRFPVIGENRDEVLGILLAKDLLPFVASASESFNIRELLRPALFIPESKRLDALLKEFRSSRNHMAVVVDEYGGVAGLVTIEDVLEQIVGEIEDEHDLETEDANVYPLGEGRFAVQALTQIDEFNAAFKTSLSDEEFDTVGGLVLSRFARLPEVGEWVDMAGLRFTVLEADARRVHLLEVCPAPEGEENDDAAGEPAPE